jgi:hypothetical protein
MASCVPAVADQQEAVAIAGEAHRLRMYLGYKRDGRLRSLQIAARAHCFDLNRLKAPGRSGPQVLPVALLGNRDIKPFGVAPRADTSRGPPRHRG